MDSNGWVWHLRIMRWLSILLFLPVGLGSCSSADAQAEGRRVILPPDQASDLWRECSRSMPQKGDHLWQPTNADLDALEAALPPALAAAPEAQGENFQRLTDKWVRQYIGFVRAGRRLIYGNYLPFQAVEDIPQWRSMAVGVCDGGPPFFGVEYDPASKQITGLWFNGSI